MEYEEQVAEERWLEVVLQEVERRLEKLEREIGEERLELTAVQRTFWEEADPTEQSREVMERRLAYERVRQEWARLKRMKAAPYFGRVDFREDGFVEEAVYVGVGSLRDFTDLDFLVYDWRAPISSLYYDALPGRAQYEAPDGLVTGELLRKRQYLIKDGVLRAAFEAGITIGDELLKESLGRRSDETMRSIVSTIQREQNRVVRNESAQVLIVRGAAGSGKTSVALQRVAYLLYRHRGKLDADQIVLFSPNALFNSYIATVLPELGERNMRQTTFREYLEYRIGDDYKLTFAEEQLEAVLTRRGSERGKALEQGIAFKSSLAFLRCIERYAEWLGNEGLPFRDITFRGETLISKQRIEERFTSLDSSIRLPNRVELLIDWLLVELKTLAETEMEKEWVEEESGLLDTEAYADSFRAMLRENRLSGDTFDDFEREREWLASRVVETYFAPLRAGVKRRSFLDFGEAYQRMFHDPAMIVSLSDGMAPELWKEVCGETLMRLHAGEMAYEDATPYLVLRGCLEGLPTNMKIRHVFIDEVQDYTPIQLALIKRLFPRAKTTLLGDSNQAIYEATGTSSDVDSIEAVYSGELIETVVFTRTYRSTKPIANFARAVLPDGGEGIEPFDRDGPMPEVISVADGEELHLRIAGRIEELTGRDRRTIAVICKSASECNDAYQALKRLVPTLNLVDRDTDTFPPGALVVPSYLAKGIEFDAVIVYDASSVRYCHESERKLFYTVCTRAMHELIVCSVGTLTPFL